MGSKKKKENAKKEEPKIAEISGVLSGAEVNIPSENVLFVGGQENFINKMKKIYPNWTYLDTEERNCKKVKGEFNLAIVKANHCSHNIIERALAHCKDVPVIYSNCTNVDRTIEEIRSSIGAKDLRFKMWDNLTLDAGYEFDIDEFLSNFQCIS